MIHQRFWNGYGAAEPMAVSHPLTPANNPHIATLICYSATWLLGCSSSPFAGTNWHAQHLLRKKHQKRQYPCCTIVGWGNTQYNMHDFHIPFYHHYELASLATSLHHCYGSGRNHITRPCNHGNLSPQSYHHIHHTHIIIFTIVIPPYYHCWIWVDNNDDRLMEIIVFYHHSSATWLIPTCMVIQRAHLISQRSALFDARTQS